MQPQDVQLPDLPVLRLGRLVPSIGNPARPVGELIEVSEVPQLVAYVEVGDPMEAALAFAEWDIRNNVSADDKYVTRRMKAIRKAMGYSYP